MTTTLSTREPARNNWRPEDIVEDCLRQVDDWFRRHGQGDDAREAVTLLRDGTDELERNHAWPEGPWTTPHVGDQIKGDQVCLEVSGLVGDSLSYIDLDGKEQSTTRRAWSFICAQASQRGLTYVSTERGGARLGAIAQVRAAR